MRTKYRPCARQLTGSRQGFTLVEALVAVIIIGLGAAAIMVSAASNTRANDTGSKLTDAVFLGQELREWTLGLPFTDPDPGDQGNPPGSDGSDPQDFVDDLDDLMGVTYAPPRDGSGAAISGMPGWSQTINMTWRDPDDLTSVVADGASNIIYVEVTLSFESTAVMETGWLVAER